METLNKTVASIVRKVAEKEGVSKAVMEDISVDPEKKIPSPILLSISSRIIPVFIMDRQI